MFHPPSHYSAPIQAPNSDTHPAYFCKFQHNQSQNQITYNNNRKIQRAMIEFNTIKKEKLNADRLKLNTAAQGNLERETAESANKKLDIMLNKIQQRLSDIKKSKKVDSDPPELSSRSSPKSQPKSQTSHQTHQTHLSHQTHPSNPSSHQTIQPKSPASSTMAINLSNSNSLDDFDEMKQIELGLIFQRTSFTNSQQKEYVRDFMNILSDDVDERANSQETASCKTQETKVKDNQHNQQPRLDKGKQEPDLKHRFNQIILKADNALKNYQRGVGRNRRATAMPGQDE